MHTLKTLVQSISSRQQSGLEADIITYWSEWVGPIMAHMYSPRKILNTRDIVVFVSCSGNASFFLPYYQDSLALTLKSKLKTPKKIVFSVSKKTHFLPLPQLSPLPKPNRPDSLEGALTNFLTTAHAND